jgi:hypothetical protein
MPRRQKESPTVRIAQLWSHSIGRPAKREYKFHPQRRWRFDLAWPERLVALEVEGGVWTGGRHTSGVGFTNDAEKYSVAAALGWAVIRATPTQIKRGLAYGWLEWALRNRKVSDEAVCHSLTTTGPVPPVPGAPAARPVRLRRSARS